MNQSNPIAAASYASNLFPKFGTEVANITAQIYAPFGYSFEQDELIMGECKRIDFCFFSNSEQLTVYSYLHLSYVLFTQRIPKQSMEGNVFVMAIMCTRH